jgi:hypothetical protein
MTSMPSVGDGEGSDPEDVKMINEKMGEMAICKKGLKRRMIDFNVQEYFRTQNSRLHHLHPKQINTAYKEISPSINSPSPLIIKHKTEMRKESSSSESEEILGGQNTLRVPISSRKKGMTKHIIQKQEAVV